MKMTRRTADILAGILIAFLLSASVTLSLLDALELPIRLGRTLLLCAAGAVWCALLTFGRISRIAALLLAGSAAFALFRFSHAADNTMLLFRTLAGLLAGGEGSLMQAADPLAAAMAVLFSLIFFGLSRLQGGVYPAVTLSAVMMIAGWSLSHRLVFAYAAPGVAGLIMLFANARDSRAGYWKPLPLAALITALALCLTPMNGLTWQPLADAAEKVRQIFEDYFLFTEPRMAYSVAADGYQPMGDLLGGPATPREGTVMQVETEYTSALLLRGSVHRTYTGHAWSDSGVNNRYLYRDLTRLNVRSEIFNTKRNDGMPGTNASVQITFTADGISTLFVPGRMTELELPMDVAAYFNDMGEVFITRGVMAGDQYAFISFEPELGEDLRQHLSGLSGGNDTAWQQAQEEYLTLPNGISRRVYQMAEEITAGCATPYDRALALRSYLLRNYRYETEVDYPPRDKDFVSWFLLDAKEGYCTYFATAMTVMARMCGLPARYVEGYLVYPEADGSTEVTGADAHAWTEIYFEGAGWIAFDATPGFSWSMPQGESQGPEPTPDPQGNMDGAGDEPEPTPQPTDEPADEPAGEPTPEPDDRSASDPTPEPESSSENEPEPTPSPEPSPSVPPQNDPPQHDQPNDRKLPGWLWMLLALILAVVLGSWRIYSVQPKKLSGKQPDADSRLMVWYRCILGALEVCGYGMEAGETPSAHCRRLSGAAPWSEKYAAFVSAVSRCRYGGRTPDAAVFRLAAETYLAVLGQMNRLQRLKWSLRRIFRGIGSVVSVP